MIKFRRAKSTDKVVDLKTFNDMQVWLERVANMTTDQHFNLTKGDPNYMLYSRTGASSSTMSYSDWAFGFSISGAVVTVMSGEVHPKKQVPIIIAQKDVTITADHQYIWVEHVLESAAIIQGPSTDRPVSDDIMFRVWLHQFRFIDGVASIEKIGHLGNIYIFGNY